MAGWPLAASLAAVTAGGLRAGRRRAALNEALHELRRPLQALALAPSTAAVPPRVESSLRMAAAALERLEREINGEPAEIASESLRARSLLEAAVARWSGPAALAGASLRLRLGGGDPALQGDRCALGQALDNLLVNAIEHGGDEIVVGLQVGGGRVRMTVRDSGRSSGLRSRRRSAAELLRRLSGRGRRGHGLRVVRRTAAAHGGGFALRRSGSGTAAVLEVPALGAREAVG